MASNIKEPMDLGNIAAYVEQYVSTDLYWGYGQDMSMQLARAAFDMASINQSLSDEIKSRVAILPHEARNLVSDVIWATLSGRDRAHAKIMTGQDLQQD
jgi:hypothetical protein